MLESIVRTVLGVLLAAVCWLVFIPVGLVLATPIILLIVLCRRSGTFKSNLADEYRKLWRFWKTVGILMVPPW